ncbi:MAG: tRNA lysidine(34) synthetase TilS [Ruminobacter sp.]|nr:tRNA lysidine(34) synthetase TilS [Ruminobacter sp.]
MINDRELLGRRISEKIDLSRYAGLNWVVALSGGADSRMLLELAVSSRKLALSVRAVYVHHHLQKVADEWVAFCENECRKTGVDFHVEHVRVSLRGSVEANARKARYEALSKYINSDKCVLFTAHHADDLLETMLMAINRGAGISGLSAIPDIQPFAHGFLARPMLAVSRSEVEEFCRINDLNYVTDPTNLSNQYDRNYLRHEVIPVIKRRFPQILSGARIVSENLRDDLLLYEDMLNEKLAGFVEPVPYAGHALNMKKLAENGGVLGDKYRKSLIRLFLRNNYGIQIPRKQLPEILKLMDSTGSNARIEAEGMVISLYRGHLFAVPDTSGLVNSGTVHVAVGEDVHCGGVVLSLRETVECGDDSCNASCGSESDIVVRDVFYLPKDENGVILQFNPVSSLRLKPSTRMHSQILKQLWKEYGIPLILRPLHPVVTDEGGNILGVHGVFRTYCDSERREGNDYYPVELTVKHDSFGEDNLIQNT